MFMSYRMLCSFPWKGHYFIFTLFSPRVMCALSYLISCTVSWIKEVASSS